MRSTLTVLLALVASCDRMTLHTIDTELSSCHRSRLTCATAGESCGVIADGCGGTLDCGACPVTPTDPAQACAAEPLRAGGTIYYACDCQAGADAGCQPGDDADAGTSPAAPLRSYAALRGKFNAMAPGDTAAFCRGGVFSADGQPWSNQGCSASATCDIRDYDPPWAGSAVANPRITATTEAFNLRSTGANQGIRLLNLDLAAPSGATRGVGLEETLDTTICNVTFDGFIVGLQDRGGPAGAHRIAVAGCRFLNISGYGMLIGGDQYDIRGNYFDNTERAVYVESGDYENAGIRVVDNEILRTDQSGGSCADSAVIYFRGQFRDSLVENNHLHEDTSTSTCAGIRIGCASATPCWSRSARIRRNRVIGLGGRPIAVDVCSDCFIEDNVIISDAAGIAAITAPTAIRSKPTDDTNTRTVIRNNTLVLTNQTLDVIGIAVGFEGDGYVVANNAIYFTGDDSAYNLWRCLALDLPAAAYALVDYNLCYFPNAASGRWASSPSQRYTLEGWRAATGFDSHSLASDPRFASAAPPYDLRPAADSPLVDAADPLSASPTDLTGKTRDAQPDIGAYER